MGSRSRSRGYGIILSNIQHFQVQENASFKEGAKKLAELLVHYT